MSKTKKLADLGTRTGKGLKVDLDKMEDEYIGKKGTPERDEYEKEIKEKSNL